MKPAIDTKVLQPLSDEQLAKYRQDGYLILRQACSADLIDVYNAHIHAIRSAEDMPQWARPRRGQQYLGDKERFSVRIFHPHKNDGFSLQMMKLPVIRGALRQIYGQEALGIQTMYFYKDPGSPGQSAHQDYYYIKNEPNTITATWMALEDVDTENGCMHVIPGSHRLGLLPHGAVRNIQEHEANLHEIEGVDLTREIPVPMKKGDVLIFDGLLIHSSTRNRSADRWRRSFVCHYIRGDSVITDQRELAPYSLA
ncbi:phytanoyl-CoA dioxygenase family protein [Paenibacillus cymbidii]|uniref:phytanoyl-CoA dioxygenase family protein n=1 Tax=Paenibacillus cymbidii TaxID=1639034 RepID=UPI0010803ABA|nr:phytanoyl-CoA dioxygenase family protein [Paenibacillus cymbidii]